MEGKAAGWLLYFVLFAAVVAAGWDQPLSYRFLSPAQLAAVRQAEEAPPPPTLAEKVSTWHPRGTSLDRAPYETTGGEIIYSKKVDQRELGVQTEQSRRPFLYEKQP